MMQRVEEHVKKRGYELKKTEKKGKIWFMRLPNRAKRINRQQETHPSEEARTLEGKRTKMASHETQGNEETGEENKKVSYDLSGSKLKATKTQSNSNKW